MTDQDRAQAIDAGWADYDYWQRGFDAQHTERNRLAWKAIRQPFSEVNQARQLAGGLSQGFEHQTHLGAVVSERRG